MPFILLSFKNNILPIKYISQLRDLQLHEKKKYSTINHR